ncbi:hypothetical protein BT67DRAFT_439205 [Trichocladium antarcticum]|uniref:Uncharacterized protein n=1 Tax=Trichocladium antarcticum TaxID=1450529 RepID=A0AAN6USR2_9PEZI|nr:hypothetical protein BT67DRAFT_439205 [Trichocladium antarcticum]
MPCGPDIRKETWCSGQPVKKESPAVTTVRERRQEKEYASCDSFRSSDLRVMSPARFHCATQLALMLLQRRAKSRITWWV